MKQVLYAATRSGHDPERRFERGRWSREKILASDGSNVVVEFPEKCG